MARLCACWMLLVASVVSDAYALPAGVEVASDIQYGPSEQHLLDVYYPAAKPRGAPVIFMVHGGAWRVGDKASRAVVRNKVAHWVPKGFVFVSANYRLIPDAYPIEKAAVVQTALLFTQQHAGEWGGSADKFILMGHSAGAHLVSMVATQPDPATAPWLGTIALDSAAYDVEAIMASDSPARPYKAAFGNRRAYWRRASPSHRLKGVMPPFLAVCSSRRREGACSQAESFIQKANDHGIDAQLLPLSMSHRAINTDLGKRNCLTRHIDAFIHKLDPHLEAFLPSGRSSVDQACAGS